MQPGWRKRTQSPSSPLCLENAGLDESRRVCCSLSMSQNNITMNIDVGLVGRDYSNQFHLPLFVFRARFYARARERTREPNEKRAGRRALFYQLSRGCLRGPNKIRDPREKATANPSPLDLWFFFTDHG